MALELEHQNKINNLNDYISNLKTKKAKYSELKDKINKLKKLLELEEDINKKDNELNKNLEKFQKFEKKFEKNEKKYEDEYNELELEMILDNNFDEFNKINNLMKDINDGREMKKKYNKELIEIREMNERFNDNGEKKKEIEHYLMLVIVTIDEGIIFPVSGKSNDKFSIIEKLFFNDYPELCLNKKGSFKYKNNLLDTNKTLEENNLKNRDIIIFEN